MRRQAHEERKARNRLYKRAVWTKHLRPNQLRKQPLCEYCGAEATDVDHIVEHDMDMRLFRDPRNLRSLCHSCHTRKSKGGELAACDENGSVRAEQSTEWFRRWGES